MMNVPTTLNAKAAKVAKDLVCLCGLSALCVVVVSAAVPPVRTMYNEALAREQTVRAAMSSPNVPQTTVQDVRAVVAAYEAVVKHYPASSYSDNALWQAAKLALDAFDTFGQPQDKDAGVRLLRKLAATYPTASLAKKVPDELVRIGVDASSLVARSSSLEKPAPATSNQQPATTPEQRATSNEKRAPSPQSPLATIRDIRRAVMPDAVRITIELDAEVQFHDERLVDPVRVFVDLAGTRAAPNLMDQTLRFEGDADIVRQVRFGRHPNNTTRVVLDAAGVSSYSVYPLYSPFRLVIDCVRPKAPAVQTAAAVPPAPLKPVTYAVIALPAKKLTSDWLRRAPANTPQHGVLLAQARAYAEPPTEPAPVSSPAQPLNVSSPSPAQRSNVSPPMTAAPAPPMPLAAMPTTPTPPVSIPGGLSMARQLGLGVSRIVIDPGHGGHDPGAKGKGVNEAELVLDVALRLEKLLQKLPGVEVILTRRTDDFIALPDRTALANRESADLFLSIHANASPNAQARGVETYFLNFANNQSAAAVAARENAASTQAMSEFPDFVKAIARNTKIEESRDFATQVQRAMVDRLRPANKSLRDLGVKQAPFVVLIGAAMPCALAEISFVTNPQEGKLVKGNPYRQRIAQALFDAIRKYQTSLKNTRTIALQ